MLKSMFFTGTIGGFISTGILFSGAGLNSPLLVSTGVPIFVIFLSIVCFTDPLQKVFRELNQRHTDTVS